MSEQPHLSGNSDPAVDETSREAVPLSRIVAAEKPMHGIGESRVAFQGAIADAMANQPATSAEERQFHYDQPSLSEANQLLRQQEVGLPALAAPAARDLKKLSPEDWEAVRGSQEPLLKLWSTRYVHAVNQEYENHGESIHHTERTAEQIQHEIALIRSLPVVQRTSLQALDAAVTDGVFRSNRGLHENGVDVTAGGNTAYDDRTLGLDNYVFADYGRPSSNGYQNSEVVVVFEPEVMQQPGTFLTEKDIRDYNLWDPVMEQPDCRKYMAGAVLAEDFPQVVMPKILASRSLRPYYVGTGLGSNYYPMELKDFVAGSNSNPDNSGQTHFSTWEIKIPGEVPVSAIRKLIFTTEQGQQNFVAKFGDIVPCELAAPEDLAANSKSEKQQAVDDRYERNLDLFGTRQRYEQELAKVRHEDHTRREAVVASSEESGEGYMLINHPAPDAPDAVKYNPRSHAVTKMVFASAEDALLMAQRDYDPGGQHAEKVVYREEVEVMRDGVLQWEKAQPRQIRIHTPEVTVAHVRHSPEAAVMTALSVKDISKS
jgi:hypothetical protein